MLISTLFIYLFSIIFIIDYYFYFHYAIASLFIFDAIYLFISIDYYFHFHYFIIYAIIISLYLFDYLFSPIDAAAIFC